MHLQAPPPRPLLALRCIALFEAAKGLLALAATCGIISLRHTDLHAATDAFLLRHGVDPERHYTRLFIESVAKATNHHTGEIAAVGFAYVLIRCVEGYGLWQGKHWAEWLAVISAALYLPLELQQFAHHVSIPQSGSDLFQHRDRALSGETSESAAGRAAGQQMTLCGQCPPVTVNPALRKSSAKSFSISTAASKGIGFKWVKSSGSRRMFQTRNCRLVPSPAQTRIARIAKSTDSQAHRKPHIKMVFQIKGVDAGNALCFCSVTQISSHRLHIDWLLVQQDVPWLHPAIDN